MIDRKRIVIVGLGQRGNAYAMFSKTSPDRFTVAAVVDIAEDKRETAKQYDCPIFSDLNDFLNAHIEADAIVIATQDKDHFEHTSACVKAGYRNILLEKPIASTLSDCIGLADIASQYGASIIVCHVLRYTPFYNAVKKILDDGILGNIVTLNASENVGYFHQAHSFVRGPWRNSVESAPMILAKCCHDLDIINWLMSKRCLRVGSFGGLAHFKRECAPDGSAEYCTDCTVADCVYRAQTVYNNHPWMSIHFLKEENTIENIMKELRHSQYDRCVYKSDNDVVDHQVTIMEFEGGATASHTMTAFSRSIYRDLKIHGTKGELVGNMEDNFFEVRIFGGGVTQHRPQSEANLNHGGGDVGLMEGFYNLLCGEFKSGISSINVSVDSHKIAFGAEESRVSGKIISIT